jgi:trk system potassium uptake protein TrkA
MARKQYAVIGLGRFGTSVARGLHEAGQEILGVDLDEDKVEDAEPFVTQAAIADSTEEKAITALEINNFDCVIVAIGDVQSIILTVMLLKNLGVNQIIAKAVGKRHGQVLEAIGVNWIIYPEEIRGYELPINYFHPICLTILNYPKNTI